MLFASPPHHGGLCEVEWPRLKGTPAVTRLRSTRTRCDQAKCIHHRALRDIGYTRRHARAPDAALALCCPALLTGPLCTCSRDGNRGHARGRTAAARGCAATVVADPAPFVCLSMGCLRDRGAHEAPHDTAVKRQSKVSSNLQEGVQGVGSRITRLPSTLQVYTLLFNQSDPRFKHGKKACERAALG